MQDKSLLSLSGLSPEELAKEMDVSVEQILQWCDDPVSAPMKMFLILSLSDGMIAGDFAITIHKGKVTVGWKAPTFTSLSPENLWMHQNSQE